ETALCRCSGDVAAAHGAPSGCDTPSKRTLDPPFQDDQKSVEHVGAAEASRDRRIEALKVASCQIGAPQNHFRVKSCLDRPEWQGCSRASKAASTVSDWRHVRFRR